MRLFVVFRLSSVSSSSHSISFIIDLAMSASTNGPTSKEEIQEIVKHLDILCPDGRSISPMGGIDGGGWPWYNSAVKDFMSTVDAYTKKYDNGIKEISKELPDEEKIKKANWEEIIQMVQNISRADKCEFWFCGTQLESGKLQQVLLRMKELAQL